MFCLLEMFNSKIGTVFTSVGKLGLALHEKFEVSVLSMGEVPYKEYILTNEELSMLRAKDECIYEIYWEIMYHFRICANISGTRVRELAIKRRLLICLGT